MSQHIDRPPALIVGASSDIAVKLARLMAHSGHPLHLAGRNIDKVKSLAEDIQIRTQTPVAAHQLDILELSALHPFLTSLSPRPQIVISMVGFMGEQLRSQSDASEAERVISSNLTGPAVLIESASLLLLDSNVPSVLVGVSSVAGDRGRAQNYYYGAAKAGFTAILSGMRQRLSSTRVSVITIKPGFVRTRATQDMDLPEFLVESDEACAARIYKSIQKRREIVYSWKWRLIMMIVRAIPETVFKRLNF